MINLPMDKVTRVSKPQADALNSMAEAGIKFNNSKVILIAVAGTIAIIQAAIKFAENHNNNKLEEEKMRHEEEMMRLEIEKMKIENKNIKEEE